MNIFKRIIGFFKPEDIEVNKYEIPPVPDIDEPKSLKSKVAKKTIIEKPVVNEKKVTKPEVIETKSVEPVNPKPYKFKFSSMPDEEKPKMLRAKTKFVLNEEAFKEFNATLRNHQVKSIEALSGKLIGQINIPTGTGKTYIQKHIIVEDMIKKTKSNQTGVYVIAAHRLTLCTQLFNELLFLSIGCGVEADMTYIGSDRYNFQELKHKYKQTGFASAEIDGVSTTSGKEVTEMVERAKKNNKHVIIVSTYHSFDRLSKLKHIDICTFDEAHTTVSDQFTNNINKVKEIIEKQYFFTATRRVVGQCGGQADIKFYGDVLYEMSPKEAVDRGEIVPPYIHIVYTQEQISEAGNVGNKLAIKTVKESFLKHKSRIKKDSFEPDKLGAKLLVTVDGLKGLHAVYNDDLFIKWCKTDNIRTFAFSSDEGQFIDFDSNSRQKTLEAMDNMDTTEDAILFHYDILTEGIDLPAITGVLLLRDLPLSKLLQNIGRGARLLKDDRTKIYSKEILPTDYSKMIKPYCWVIVPHYPKINYDRTKKMIKNLRETYDIPLENIEVDDRAIADTDDLVPVVTKPDVKDGRQYELEHMFEDIVIEEYDDIFFSVKDRVRFMKNTIDGDL